MPQFRPHPFSRKAVSEMVGLRRIKSSTWILVVTALFAYLRPVFLGRTSAQSPTVAPPTTTSKQKSEAKAESSDDIADPKLIALTWQYRPQASRQRIRQPVWRPDGTRLTVAETDSLLDDVESFQSHWRQPGQLSPLVLIFRRETTIKTGLSPAVVLADGRRLWSGTWGPFLPNGLTQSACAPRLSDLAKWPEVIDVDVKVPLEEPQIIKTVQPVPDGAVEVAPGVRWYIDPDRGIDFQQGGERRQHLPAAVFEIENESPDDLVSYQPTVWLRGKEAPLSGSYATKILPRPGVWLTIRVSKPLDGLIIEKVEFTRQRFEIQRFKGVKLRVDLLPPRDDVPDRDRPGQKQKTATK